MASSQKRSFGQLDQGMGAPLGRLGQAIRPVPEPEPVDSVDLALLQHLSTDARQSQRALAKLVGMSGPAVGERLARLERIGVLQRYTIDVDWAKLGYPTIVHLPVVAVTGADIGEMMSSLAQLAEVEDINVVSGSYDLLVRLRVRDHNHLSQILLEAIWQIPTLQRTETLLCLAEAKQAPFTEKLLAELQQRSSR